MSSKYVWISLLAFTTGLVGCEKLGIGGDKKSKTSKSDESEETAEEEEDKDKGKAEASAAPVADPTPAPAPAPAPIPAGPVGKAASHLPADCEVALTINLGKAMAHPSFASKVVPAIEGSITNARTTGKDPAKVSALLDETAFNFKAIEDVAVCVKDVSSAPRFAAVVAGGIKPGSLVPAIQKADATAPVKDLNGVQVVSDAKLTMGQLPDGSIAFSEQEDMFSAVVPTGTSASTVYALASDKEIALAVAPGVIGRAAAGGGGALPPGLDQIQKVSGSVDLTASKVALRLGTAGAEEAKKLEAMLVLMKDQAGQNAAGMPPGVADALKALSLRIEGNDVVAEAALPAGAVDALATGMAEDIKAKAAALPMIPSGGDAKAAEPAPSGTPSAASPTPKPTATSAASAKPTATATATATAAPTATATATARPTATATASSGGGKRPFVKFPPPKK